MLMYKVLLGLVIASWGLMAQVALVPSANSVRPGQEVDVVISVSSGASSGLQWSLSLPANYVLKGSASTAPEKTLSCHLEKCVLVGLNKTAIAAGVVATQKVAVPASAAPGVVEIPMSEVYAVDLNGMPLTITGQMLSLRVLASHDLNGDGRTDAVDLLIVTNQILGLSPCSSGDLDGDGKCTIHDAGVVVRGAQ